MKTVKELGQLIKAKHSQYSDMSDEECGLAVKEAFPGKYDDYVSDPTDVFSLTLAGNSNNTGLNKQTLEHLKSLENYYFPNRGIWTSNRQTRRSEARLAMLKAHDAEANELMLQARRLEEAVRAGTKREIAFKIFVAENAVALTELKGKFELLEGARAQGLTVDNDQQLKVESGLSNVRINEHEQITQINLDSELEKQRETMRLAMLASSMSLHQEIGFIQDLIDSIYKQIEEISHSRISIGTRERMIDDREDIIKSLKKDRRAKQSRLVQNTNRKNI